jgi:hypothetical protein
MSFILASAFEILKPLVVERPHLLYPRSSSLGKLRVVFILPCSGGFP